MIQSQNTTMQVGDIGIWRGKRDITFRVHRTGDEFADIEWLWDSVEGFEKNGHITNLHGGDATRIRYSKDCILLVRPDTSHPTTVSEVSE